MTRAITMRGSIWAVLVTSIVSVYMVGSAGAQGARPGGPSQEMLAACATKTAGDACSSVGPEGSTVTGTCFAPRGLPLACRPVGGPRGPEGNAPPPATEQGTPIAATQADTSAVLCKSSRLQMNTVLGIQSDSTWTCADGQRVLTANGIPDHDIGTFPNAGNPGTDCRAAG